MRFSLIVCLSAALGITNEGIVHCLSSKEESGRKTRNLGVYTWSSTEFTDRPKDRSLLRKVGKRDRVLFGREYEKDGALVGEDEEYWQRFLAKSFPTPPPTPPPTPELPCLVQVDVSCIYEQIFSPTNISLIDCNDIPHPESISDCLVPIEYLYTVTNIGTSTIRTIDLLSTASCQEPLGGITPPICSGLGDITSDLSKTTNLLVAESAIAVRPTQLDLCDTVRYNISAFVSSTSSTGEVCQDDDRYQLIVNPICDCDVEIECELLDAEGMPTGIDCRDIPPAQVVEECDITVQYTYVVTNNGVTDAPIVSLVRTRADDVDDLIGLLQDDDNVLEPGASAIAVETDDINRCVGQTFTTRVVVQCRNF